MELIIYPSQSREIPNREGIPCTFDDEGPDEARFPLMRAQRARGRGNLAEEGPEESKVQCIPYPIEVFPMR
jgi:hypothetical protein